MIRRHRFYPVGEPAPDRRRVAFAVELVDAVTLGRVSQGVELRCAGFERAPVVNGSGYLVFLEEPGHQAGRLSVTATDGVYLPAERDGPAPDHDKHVPLLVVLTPGRAYPFPDGAMVVRGWVVAGQQKLEGVTVQAAWASDGDRPTWQALPLDARTDAAGEFARFLPLPAAAFAHDPAGGGIALAGRRRARVRLGLIRDGVTKEVPEVRLLPGESRSLDRIDWDRLA